MRILRSVVMITSFLMLLYVAALAQREPVLKQIDLPHPYYFREMYLPQLTSGPSWVSWAPDSKEVVYSMAGSLWRQKIDSAEAVQLTDGPGYDYQPDWSRDGKWIVYTKYDHDALELWLLEVATGKTGQLTKDGAVNVEPRFSPDSRKILYVSTRDTKHFHLWLMELGDVGAGLRPAQRGSEIRVHTDLVLSNRQLTKEFRSDLPRYYYSQFDHEINPTWSPDGKEIVFVSNHGHIHGTGGIWRAKLPETPNGMIDVGKDAKEIHYEETTWKARPEFAPDGKRIVYASYAGRQWHQLWLMTADGGGNVFPLTYGEYDNINPRWSPDGAKIASISNGDGNVSIKVQDLENGSEAADDLQASSHRYLAHKGNRLGFIHACSSGGWIASRMTVAIGGRALFPHSSWIIPARADDSYDRKLRANETQYFFDRAASNVFEPLFELPFNEEVVVTASHGLSYQPGKTRIIEHPSPSKNVFDGAQVELEPLQFGSDNSNWKSGDLHLHMNYAGTYRTTPPQLLEQFDAEDLDVGFNLIVNKEQRFPDVEYRSSLGEIKVNGDKSRVLATGQEFHTSFWGHLGLLNIKHLILPGYAAYPNTAAASLVPMNADVADMAHAQSKDALVGYVHPFDELPDPYKDPKLTDELPVDVALGKVDYYEVLGFSDHKASAAIWYRLLNLGFRLPAGAGTDAMTNFASLRGPVGLNRVYVNVSPGALNLDEWLKGLKAGKTFATNGPLLRFSLGGQPIGGELKLEKPGQIAFTAAMRSIVAADKVEVVCNGEVMKALFPAEMWTRISDPRNADQRSASTTAIAKDSQGHPAITSFDTKGTIPIQHSGWCAMRAYSDHAEEPIMDIYPYGTTSPIYVTVAGEKPRSPEDAKFFMKWIDRIEESASQWKEYNTDAEKQHVMEVLHRSRAVYEELAK
jgi:TolB protein